MRRWTKEANLSTMISLSNGCLAATLTPIAGVASTAVAFALG
jgi:hypothetical protein